MSVKALVLTAPGINCHRETAYAFEEVGAQTDLVHINELCAGEKKLDNYSIFAIPGGFSAGDHLGAGKILGLKLRTELAEDLTRFLATGKAAVGICNGMQVLIESGLLPSGVIDGTDKRTASLTFNKMGGFHCGWKRLAVGQSVCKYVRLEDYPERFELQVAHGEGRLELANEDSYQHLIDNGQVVFQFCDTNGQPTEHYPDNPNGSRFGITGICDPSGQILGMMPHPERSIATDRRRPPVGRILFQNMFNYVKEL